MDAISKDVKDLAKTEKEVEALEKQLETTKNMKGIPEDLETPELEKLRTENLKLKYQLHHLEKHVLAEEFASGQHMVSLLEAVESLFREAICGAFPEVNDPPVLVTASTKEAFGEYQCNSAMTLCKLMSESKKKPREIAESIVQKIPENSVIGKVEIAGPGFINIWLSKELVAQEVLRIVLRGVRPPNLGPTRRVIIDMSSPNIAKEMHVGHLRSTIIGESISRLLQFIGHDLLKLNHLGDWGTQFGMLIAHLQDKFPNYKEVSPPIQDLQAFYKESKVRFDQDETFKVRAYEAVVKLQSKDPDHIRAWNLICDVSKAEFVKVYERLNVKDLVDRGESFYQDLMVETVQKLDKLGVLELDDGRKIAWAPTGGPKSVNVPLTIVKSDGGFTYDTSDVAALWHRLVVEKADWILYVIDQGQSLHMETCFKLAQNIGWYDPAKTRVEHIGFGVVLGEDKKKFKTRSGDTVRLIDLLNEGVKRSSEKLREKGRHEVLTEEEFTKAADAIAYGCIKYADLSHSRTNDYIFSFDKMLDDRGNTAVYLQYAFMRIRSIARLAGVDPKDVLLAAGAGQVDVDHPAEWKLAKFLLRWPEVVTRAVGDFLLHNICDYLYELAGVFTEFYDNCYVVEKDRATGEVVKVNMGRLVLCDAAAKIMQSGFDVLAIGTVERM